MKEGHRALPPPFPPPGQDWVGQPAHLLSDGHLFMSLLQHIAMVESCAWPGQGLCWSLLYVFQMLTWIQLPSLLQLSLPDARCCTGQEGQCWGQCCSQGFPSCPPACQHASSESSSCYPPNGMQGFAEKTWELTQRRHKFPGQATSSPSPVLAERGIWMHRKHQGSQPQVIPAMGWHFTYHLPGGTRDHDSSPTDSVGAKHRQRHQASPSATLLQH